MIALYILGYVLLGLFFATFAAQVFEQRNQLENKNHWHDEFETTLGVVVTFLLWPVVPVLWVLYKVGGWAFKGYLRLARYAAKELMNPRENTP